MINKKCPICKEDFETKIEKQKYCSLNCRGKSRVGFTWEQLFGKEKANKMKIFSEEHKKNISLKLTGRKLSDTHRENLNETSFKKGYKWKDKFDKETIEKMRKYSQDRIGIPRPDWVNAKISESKLGHKVSKDTRMKISKAFKGKTYEEIMGKEKAEIRKEETSKRMKGKKNYFYLGKPALNYDFKVFNNKFKNKIRERDNQICLNCGIHREKLVRALDIHHINYNEEQTIPENCITLCRKCHGLTSINREYWIKLFHDKLSKLYGYEYSKEGEIVIKYV